MFNLVWNSDFQAGLTWALEMIKLNNWSSDSNWRKCTIFGDFWGLAEFCPEIFQGDQE